MRSSENSPWANFRLCEVALLGHHPRSARHGSVVRATGCFETNASFHPPPLKRRMVGRAEEYSKQADENWEGHRVPRWSLSGTSDGGAVGLQRLDGHQGGGRASGGRLRGRVEAVQWIARRRLGRVERAEEAEEARDEPAREDRALNLGRAGEPPS